MLVMNTSMGKIKTIMTLRLARVQFISADMRAYV